MHILPFFLNLNLIELNLQVIYFTKMRLFANQLNYSETMKLQLQRMVQFISLLYVPAWLSAPLAANAPGNDLRLYQDLLRYQTVDKEVADAALAVMRRHMAYMRPETVVLSLTSEAVSAEEKAEMALKLLSKPVCDDAEDTILQYVDADSRLADFVDGSSWLVFQLLKVDASRWLDKPVSTWEADGEYQAFERFVRDLKVTNDVAERGVALIQDFAHTITKDDQQLQWLLQAVEAHRKRVPSFEKHHLDSL